MTRTGISMAFLPAGDHETASTRLRVMAMQRELERLGCRVRSGYSGFADVVVVQKRVTAGILKCVQSARKRGQFVVYDVDDLGEALAFWAPDPLLRQMLPLADLVSACSAGVLNYLASLCPIKSGVVIESAIDYAPEGPVPAAEPREGALRLLWFGNSSNFPSFERYLPGLRRHGDVRLVALVDRRRLAGCASEHPDVEFHPWALDTVVPLMRGCDLACLVHEETVAGQAKSNSKMTTAITWGVPVLASRTEAYARTAGEIGLEDALFNTSGELDEALARYRSREARMRYLAQAQAPIWSRYSAASVARSFLSSLPTDRRHFNGIGVGPLIRWLRW